MVKTRTIGLKIALIASLFAIPEAIAQVVNVWSAAPMTSAQMFQKGVGADDSGSVYTVSGFRGEVDFGRGPFAPPSGERGLSFAKYEATGFHLGAKGTAYSAGTLIFDMVVSGNGDVFVVGYFEGTSTDLGGGLVPNVNGDTESFIVKYDQFGFYKWAHLFDTGSNASFRHVAVDDSGSVYLYGNQDSALDFGGGTLDSGQFLVKYNNDGEHQWSKTLLPNLLFGVGIALDQSNSIIVFDRFFGPIDFGGGTIQPTGIGDFFVAKFDAATGAHQWSMGLAAGTPNVVATDPSGHIFLTATGSGPIDFGGGPLAHTGTSAVFFAKLDADGGHVWSRVSSSASTQLSAGAIAANQFGELYVAGQSNAAVDLGGGNVNANFGTFGSFMFMVKYDADGDHVWSDGIGSTESVFATNLAIDNANRIFLGGGYTGIVDLGTGPFPDAGPSGIAFIAGFFDTSVPIGGGECFIATAAYGSPMAEELRVFRDVRDRFLLQTCMGAVAVDTYYSVSPPIAGFIADHPSLRTAIRNMLKPVYLYCSALVAAPKSVSALTLFLGVSASFGCIALARRSRRRTSQRLDG